MGDYLRLLQLRIILEEIKNDHLHENVLEFERNILQGFSQFEKHGITNVRGQGVIMAFDIVDVDRKNRFIKKMLDNGVNLGTCGPQSIRLRPSLTVSQENSNALIEIASHVLKNL